MEQLAAAIVGALVASAPDLTKKVVNDAYEALKATLSGLMPTFKTEEVSEENIADKEAELSRRLGGLDDAELGKVEEAAGNLLDVVDPDKLGRVLGDRFVVEDVEAEEQLEIDTETTGSDDVSIIRVSGKNVRIAKRIVKL